MKHLALTLATLLSLAALPAHAQRQAAGTPYVNPVAAEYHTGVLELDENSGKHFLRLADGKRMPLINETSGDMYGAVDDMANNITAFVGSTITVRGLRYKTSRTSRTSVLAIQSFAPGKSQNFIAGRLKRDETGVYLPAPGNSQASVYLRGALGKRFLPHTDTLPTQIGMGDGVIIYGEIETRPDGTLSLVRAKPDVWYLIRPWGTKRRNTAAGGGTSYRLLGMQTPATSNDHPRTGRPAYGHLEVPARTSLKGNKLGDDRTMVLGRAPTATEKLRFRASHPSIRVIGSKFSAPISSSINGYIEPGHVRLPVAKAKPRTARRK